MKFCLCELYIESPARRRGIWERLVQSEKKNCFNLFKALILKVRIVEENFLQRDFFFCSFYNVKDV